MRKQTKRKIVPRCIICGGTGGSIAPREVGKYTVLAHESCAKNCPEYSLEKFLKWKEGKRDKVEDTKRET